MTMMFGGGRDGGRGRGGGRRGAQPKNPGKEKQKKRCPQTGRGSGGVLLVAEHRDHGPCLVVYHNRAPDRHWECPFGRFDGPPKHATVADAAAEELWEETCALVQLDSAVLLAVAQRGPAAGEHPGVHDGWFALRVDGLSRQAFRRNRAALAALRATKLRGLGLGAALEMDGMRFLPLASLSQAPLAGDPNSGVCAFADVDGKPTELGLLAKQLRGGGLELAHRAFAAGDVRELGAWCAEKVDPSREFAGKGRRKLDGVRTLVIGGVGAGAAAAAGAAGASGIGRGLAGLAAPEPEPEPEPEPAVGAAELLGKACELLGQPLLGKAYLLFFPTGTQSPKDHVTIDQFDCDVAGDFEQVARIVQNVVATTLEESERAAFEIFFRGDPNLLDQPSKPQPDFSSPERTIETFRRRAGFRGYSRRAGTERTVTGVFHGSRVAVVSCAGVGRIRFRLEQNELLNGLRGRNMPR